MAQPNDLLAVLIDADNVPASSVGAILTDVVRLGIAPAGSEADEGDEVA